MEATPPTRARRFLVPGLCALTVVILVLTGSGFSLSHTPTEATERAAAAPAQDTISPGGLVATVDLHVEAFGTQVSVDRSVNPPAASDAPLPDVSVQRGLLVPGLGAPVGAAADLTLASGASARDASGGARVATVATQALAAVTPGQEVALLAAAAFASMGLLAYFWASVKTWAHRFLFVPLIPLYAHITRQDVLHNAQRERIFDTIRNDPGVSASELARRSALSWGNTIYHLEVLQQTRMISSVRDGRYRRYFANGAVLLATKETLAILKNPVTAQVADEVRARPGACQKDLAAAVGLSPQALHWHLCRLVKAGIVEKRREGRTVLHYAPAA